MRIVTSFCFSPRAAANGWTTSIARPRRRDGERSRGAGARGAAAAPPAGGSFMTHLRQRLKSRRPSKKPLAFDGDSNK
jgi:hypothetical protein